MVHKKQVEFVSKSRVPRIEGANSVVEQAMGRFEAIYHYAVVLANGLGQILPSKTVLLAPHLQYVDHLTHIVA